MTAAEARTGLSCGFQFGLVAACADRNFARLHRLRNAPHEIDLQQAALERGALDLDVVIQIEMALERTRRDALIKEFSLRRRLHLAAGNGQLALLRRDGDVVGREPGDREPDPVAILAAAQDVVGRVIVDFQMLVLVDQVEETVEPDGRTPQGRKIESPHSHILRVSNMVSEQVHRTAAPAPAPSPAWALGGKNLGTRFSDFKGGSTAVPKNFPEEQGERHEAG